MLLLLIQRISLSPANDEMELNSRDSSGSRPGRVTLPSLKGPFHAPPEPVLLCPGPPLPEIKPSTSPKHGRVCAGVCAFVVTSHRHKTPKPLPGESRSQTPAERSLLSRRRGVGGLRRDTQAQVWLPGHCTVALDKPCNFFQSQFP